MHECIHCSTELETEFYIEDCYFDSYDIKVNFTKKYYCPKCDEYVYIQTGKGFYEFDEDDIDWLD
jgi:ATP sulfurylase (sulfate adenylyltransferase)